MSDKKISQLNTFTGAEVDINNDLLVIVDISAGSAGTKKITPKELSLALPGGSGTATTATNIAGGSAGQIPIQSAPGQTTFISTSSLYVGRAQVADSVGEVILTTSSNTLLDFGTTFVIAFGEITLTLPTAVGISGKKYNIQNSGTNSITVIPQGGQVINGNINMTMTETNSVMGLMSDGANWRIF